ncbi:hypothetical protein PIB30_058869 [Stylosanthes scabra]|uniref:RNase H type-1 domain-containing protein n=1 Tax=Stylosanthes scabra TaxID=79078 RepID=A0ABU6UNN3_9FABA|nr:hypothetical protein [Stylosanthes scabra]
MGRGNPFMIIGPSQFSDHHELLLKIQDFLLRNLLVRISLIQRSANTVADSMARSASTSQQVFTERTSPLNDLLILLQQDGLHRSSEVIQRKMLEVHGDQGSLDDNAVDGEEALECHGDAADVVEAVHHCVNASMGRGERCCWMMDGKGKRDDICWR